METSQYEKNFKLRYKFLSKSLGNISEEITNLQVNAYQVEKMSMAFNGNNSSSFCDTKFITNFSIDQYSMSRKQIYLYNGIVRCQICCRNEVRAFATLCFRTPLIFREKYIFWPLMKVGKEGGSLQILK